MPTQNATSRASIQSFHSVTSILADVAIMDYFIHQSIVYRLHFLNPEIDEEGRHCGLEMAFSYALNADQMNRFMLELLRACNFSPEQLPIDEKSRVRRVFGKVMGNAFFFSDTTCEHFNEEQLPIGACCVEHEMEGWKRAVRDLALIPFPDGEEASFVDQQIALRAAIVIYSNVTFDEWVPLVNQVLMDEDVTLSQPDNPMFLTQTQGSSPFLQSTLQSRIRELRQKLLACHTRRHFAAFLTDLKRSYNVDRIRSNLLTWLQTCYQRAELEPPSVLLATQKSLEQASTLSPIRLSPRRSPEKSSPLTKRGVSLEKERHEPIPFHGKFIPPEHLREIGGGLLEEVERGENKEANDWLKTLKRTENRSITTTTDHGRAERVQWSDDDLGAIQQLPSLSTSRNIVNASNEVFIETDHKQGAASRPRKRFTEDETARLIVGVKRFGRDWVKIRQHYAFDGRTNVDLKDKARNLVRVGLLTF